MIRSLSDVMTSVRVWNSSKFNRQTMRDGAYDTVVDSDAMNTAIGQGKAVVFVSCQISEARELATILASETGFNWHAEDGKPAIPATAVSPAKAATSVYLSVRPAFDKVKFGRRVG